MSASSPVRSSSRRDTLEGSRTKGKASTLGAKGKQYGAEVKKQRVEVKWDGDQWFSGVICEYSAIEDKHLIRYDDGEQQWHDLGEDEEAGDLRWPTSQETGASSAGGAKAGKRAAAKAPSAKAPSAKVPSAKAPSAKAPRSEGTSSEERPAKKVKPATAAAGTTEAEPQAAGMAEAGDGSHPGMTCDRSGMSPIVGVRYHLRGSDYDLCEAEYEKLPSAQASATLMAADSAPLSLLMASDSRR